MTTPIGTIGDFPEGKATAVAVDGRRIAVINVEGDLYALQDNCPHKNLPLSVLGDPSYRGETGDPDGEIPTLGRIEAAERAIDCPWHNLEWDLETGACPAIDTRIPTYEVIVEDGRVAVDL